MGMRRTRAEPRPTSGLEAARGTVERLRGDLRRLDRSLRHRYIRAFEEEWRTWEALSSWDDLIVECWRSDLVWIGDFHALSKSQEAAARLLRDVASRSRETVLALEMVFSRNQRDLDAWMAGTLAEEAFLRRIRYDREWGYDWESFRRVFLTAREMRVPVLGVDCEPRRGFRKIARRDFCVAAKIASIFQERPGAKVLVLFGESHLATAHLPGRVRKILHSIGLEKRDTVVVQNPDEMYWALAEAGHPYFEVVRAGAGRYAVFNATPLEKWEAYRRAIETWASRGEEEEGEADATPALHALVDAILRWLGVDGYRFCAEEDGLSVTFLVDSYPEVYPAERPETLRAQLRPNDFTPEEAREVEAIVEERGSFYVPRVNGVFLRRFRLAEAAEDAAHFLHAALRHELWKRPPAPIADYDRFYREVLAEALAFLGSKVTDPGRNFFSETDLYRLHRASEEEIRATTGLPADEFRETLRFVLVHRAFAERHDTAGEIPREVLDGIRTAGRRFRVLTRELGRFLGQAIWEAVQARRVRIAEVRDLFRRRFEKPEDALTTYLEWARRTRA